MFDPYCGLLNIGKRYELTLLRLANGKTSTLLDQKYEFKIILMSYNKYNLTLVLLYY